MFMTLSIVIDFHTILSGVIVFIRKIYRRISYENRARVRCQISTFFKRDKLF